MKYLGAYAADEDIATKIKIGGTSVVVATGAEVNTGTNNVKVVTPKAVADSNLLTSVDGTVTNIIALTKAQYDALSAGQKAGNTYITTDEPNDPNTLIPIATYLTNGLMTSGDKVLFDGLLPVPLTFNYVTDGAIVTQATKTAVAYWYPTLGIGFIRLFMEVGTGDWAQNTVVTIGTLLNPSGHNIITQSLVGSRSYAWSGIVEPTLVDVATGGDVRITMKNAIATSGMNIYITGMFIAT